MALKKFPRGGKKPDIKAPEALFSNGTKIKSKKQKTKEKNRSAPTEEAVVFNSAQNLRFNALQEGMVILGRIYKITDYHAIVSLPGQLSGTFQATDLNETYTNLLKDIANNKEISTEFKTVSEIYKEGDYVICYVKVLDPKTKRISLSLEPQLINQNLNPNNLVKSSKVILTVSSVEDHGYVLDTGLTNFRAFLSIKDVGSEEIKLYPGKQIICAVKDIKNTGNIYTAKVSCKEKHLNSIETNVSSLDNLIPGAQFSLSITKILKNGLQVSFGENCTGYINQLYLQKPLPFYEKGQELVGTLLYILPTVKFGYFSLLSQKDDKSLSIDDIVTKAKVISLDSRGILMRLKKGVRGYIPLKRTEVDFEKISSVFATDSIHKCKIIAYDLMSKLYICTREKKMMDDSIITTSSIKPGDKIEVIISRIHPKTGVINVTAGRVHGIVSQDQANDPGSTNNFKEGQTVQARVLDCSEKVFFTLKKSLVESKLPILCKVEEAKVSAIHDGSIVRTNEQGALVRFFGNVKGWIPSRFLPSKKINLIVGQTVTVTINDVNLEKNRLTLAFTNDKKNKSTKYKVGDLVEGTVIDSSSAGIKLRLKDDEDVEAFLPAGHISPCLEIGHLLASKVVAGDEFSAIVFSINPNLILSTQFAPESTYELADLSHGDSFLCSVKRVQKDSIKLIMPIMKCLKYGTVLLNDVGNFESVYENQILYAKILKINKETQEINLTTQLSKVWKDVTQHEVKMMSAVDVLSFYLATVLELSKNVYYTSKAISKLTLGERVTGVVESVMDHGLVLKLDKNVMGIVRRYHIAGDYKQGDKVEGSVLWINYPHEYAEVTLVPTLINSISVKQNKLVNLPLGIQLRGTILLITEWFILVLLKGQGKGALVSLPARRHLNDTVPDLSPYQFGDKVRCYVVLDRKDAELILPICLLKSAFEIDSPLPEESPKSLKRKLPEDSKSDESAHKAKKGKNVEAVDDKSKFEEKRSKKRKKNPEALTELEAVDDKPQFEEKTSKKKKKNPEALTELEAVDDKPQFEEKTSKKKRKNPEAHTELEAVDDKPKFEEKTSKKKKKNPEAHTELEAVDDKPKFEEKISKKKKKSSEASTELEKSEEAQAKSDKNKLQGRDTADRKALVIAECGFNWDTTSGAAPAEESSSSSEEEEEDDATKAKPKRKKLSAAERRELERQKEREIREREEALARSTIPQTAEQFDRLVLSSPDSSLLWVQYMVHHLQATEIERARAVARRALKTINFRLEEERLNVWKALLNLESHFGTAEGLQEVFQEAVKCNDACAVYSHMLDVHVEAGRQSELEKLAQAMIGKFKQEPETWTSCGAAFLKVGLKDKSRHLMQRALQSLPANQHVDLMVKFARLENKFGDKERSQTLFEQVLSSYPKRTDVWSSYVDSLVKKGDIDLARKILDRAVAQALPAKKMKILFKKYLNFEEKHGTADSVNRIRELAVKYVEEECNKVD